MRGIRFIYYALFITLLACSSDSSEKRVDEELSKKEVLPELYLEEESESGFLEEKNEIKLRAINTEQAFPDASLSLHPISEEKLKAGKIQFEFEVEGFDLGNQTRCERNNVLASSDQGQHIHFILNNGPYSAHYISTIEKDLEEGNNVVLAFLARSYHESVKGAKAFIFKNFAIGENNPPFDLKAPHLIYSRPKGKYKERIDPLLLDFYLINAKLSEDGFKVRLTIDNTQFTLASWQPYLVEGLKEGEHKFRIQLIDRENKVVPGPFNDSGERTIKLIK